MNKRERLFIQHYTDTTCKETYGNGLKSALKAGYSQRNAASQASRLLKKPIIANEIHNIEKVEATRYEATKDQAILEAREGFLKAKTANDKSMMKYWNDLWVNLQGWLVTKVESKNENIIKEAEKEAMYDTVREYMQGLN